MDDVLPPPRRRSWLLIASLCVNVALIAFVAVALWRVAHVDRSIGAGVSPLAPKHVIAEFPGRAGAIQAVIEAHRAKIVTLRAATVSTRLAAAMLLASPDYTPATMQDAMAAIAKADAALEAEDVRMATDGLSTLSPDERKTLVERLKRRNRSWFYKTFHPRGRM
jgi:uncharacterized membrane protein